LAPRIEVLARIGDTPTEAPVGKNGSIDRWLLICAFLVGCSGGFDGPAGVTDSATTHDATRSSTRDEDPESRSDAPSEQNDGFDASSEPANDRVDASSEPAQGEPSDAGVNDASVNSDWPVKLPEDAARDHDSVPQDSLPADATWPWANNEAGEAEAAGEAEGGQAGSGSDSSTPSDQGPTADAVVGVPTIDSSPPDVTWCGNQTFTTTITIDSGKTVAICAGSVLTFGSSVSLVVLGTLLAQGTASMPVRLVGQQPNAGAWGGMTTYAGGAAVLTNTEIHDATMAFSTAVSAKYSLNHVVLGNSRQLLHLMSSGTIAHATMHALGEVQSSIGDAIVIDDASPHITDSTVDNGSSGADLVQVNGASSAPIFERMDVSHSHCAFHFNTSTNATIKSSYIHDCNYGLMVVYGVDSLLTGNNFERNSFALGLCLGSGSATFRGNYVDGTFADSGCTNLQNESPAISPIPGVGPGP
jgi:hypothetical protein